METISVVWYLTHLRKDILDNPDDVTFGIPNTTMILLYKYVTWTESLGSLYEACYLEPLP